MNSFYLILLCMDDLVLEESGWTRSSVGSSRCDGSNVRTLYKEYMDALDSSVSVDQDRSLRWRKPQQGVIEINCDTSRSNCGSQVGVAVVAKESKLHPGGFLHKLDILCSVDDAELLAFTKGLEMAVIWLSQLQINKQWRFKGS